MPNLSLRGQTWPYYTYMNVTYGAKVVEWYFYRAGGSSPVLAGPIIAKNILFFYLLFLFFKSSHFVY